MKCPNCNNDNFDYEKFCHVCGIKLPAPGSPQSTAQNKNKYGRKDFIIRLIIAFLFAIAIILYQLRALGMI